MDDAITPIMPSNQEVAFNAVMYSVNPTDLATFYANYCAKLAGNSAKFWLWRHSTIIRDDKWGTIARTTYPHDFVESTMDIPSAFYEGAHQE